MANVVVEEQSLIDIANAIRTQNETTNTYKPSEMANAILDIPTNEVVEPTLQEKTITPTTSSQTVTPDTNYDGLSKVTINGVTSAIDSDIKAINIRKGIDILGVTGTMEEYVAPKLQSKSATPKTTLQTITPDSSYDGLSSVSVGAVTSSIDSNITASNIKSGVSILGVEGTLEEGITPTGTLEITENGTYDVTEYASANVSVASSGGGDDGLAGSIIDRTITEFNDNNILDVGHSAFRACSKVKTINIPKATTVADYGFYQCSSLTSLNLPSVTSVGQQVIYGCNKLTSLSLPSLISVSTNALREAQYLEIVDLPKLTNIATQTFYGCRGLKALILRSETLVTLANTNAFTTCYRILGTKNSGFNPNGEKIGFFYVPKALIEDYRVATNWSSDSLVTQFRALEDYTVDGTITGELDPNKI